MLIEDISLSQIMTAIVFIAILIAIQIFITKNKNTLKGKWGHNKRVILTESTRLGPTEKVQIIKVDSTEYLYFFSKGNQPVIIPMNPTIESSPKKKIKSNSYPNNLVTKTKDSLAKVNKQVDNDSPKRDNNIIQAISAARKQNPKVSFE